MTTLRRSLALGLVGTTVLVLSCSKAPTAPSITGAAQIPAIQMSTASQAWTRASLAVDSVVHCECLGENLHFVGQYAFQYHFVATGSGSFQIQRHVLPVTPKTSAPVAAYAETSGKVFMESASPVAEIFNLGSQIQVQTFVDRERYAAADGSRLVVTSRIHVTADGNGHVIVQKIEPLSIECSK